MRKHLFVNMKIFNDKFCTDHLIYINIFHQIYFKNPKTLELFLREGIPEEVTFDEILSRKYSFPNDDKLPIKFYEAESDENNKLIINLKHQEMEGDIYQTCIQEAIWLAQQSHHYHTKNH